MGRQGDWVQLEQSDMCLALNVAKMAKGGISRGAIEETQQPIRILEPKPEKRRSQELRFTGIRR
jgi:hypothetical protein